MEKSSEKKDMKLLRISDKVYSMSTDACQCCASNRSTCNKTFLVPYEEFVLPQSKSPIPETWNFDELDEFMNSHYYFCEDMLNIFHNQVNEVNKREMIVRENEQALMEIESLLHVRKVELIQLEDGLNWINLYANGIDSMLEVLEQQTERVFCSSTLDHERLCIYEAPFIIEKDLKCMENSLEGIIPFINAKYDTPDPLIQIVQILGSYIDTLTWLEAKQMAMQQQLTQINDMNDLINTNLEPLCHMFK